MAGGAGCGAGRVRGQSRMGTGEHRGVAGRLCAVVAKGFLALSRAIAG